MTLRAFLIALWLLPAVVLHGQQSRLDELNAELQRIQAEEARVLGEIEQVKLGLLREDLMKYALPALGEDEELVVHSAMALVYSEDHEQARWVAHVVRPEVVDGTVGRSNDFRPDPKIASGSAEEADYFLKQEMADGTIEYDGFGFDRGHLAPSADFRWSPTALSESYFYSNMSPQRPDFNRGIWADLEGSLRACLERHAGHQLLVVTGPVLREDLPRSERSVNGLSIPESYFKVVVDLQSNQGIGFVLPNQGSSSPLTSFVKSISEVEELTGINFFAQLPQPTQSLLEGKVDVEFWLPAAENGDVDPLPAPKLPRNHFNTTQARLYMDRNETVNICGKVVGARYSRNGNVLLNLDRAYPNQVFTVFVKKEHLPNFSYDPVEEWNGRYIRVTGKVAALGGTPAMFLEKEEQMGVFRIPGQ